VKHLSFDLRTETIELQQLLKATDMISSGGDIRGYLAQNRVFLNDEPEDRRSRKIRAGDVVRIGNDVSIEVRPAQP
jgi:ribosome-associated protein